MGAHGTDDRGGTLSADRAGRGEPLLLLHGIGTTRTDLARVMGRLTAHHDVLAVDLPGHGRSPAPPRRPTVAALTDAVEADLDARALATVHVMGNSLGGRIALELARRGRTRSVVAVAPSGLAGPAERAYQAAVMTVGRISLRAIAPLVPALAGTPAGRVALLAPMRARPWAATPAEALALRDGLARAVAFWEMLRTSCASPAPCWSSRWTRCARSSPRTPRSAT